MNAMKAVTDLAVFLSKNQGVKVFKYEKDNTYTGEYLVVNSLSFTYEKTTSDSNRLNINIHVPDNTSGSPNSSRLSVILSSIESLIPRETGEEDSGLAIGDSIYTLLSDSNAMKDNDNTHFLNLKIIVRF